LRRSSNADCFTSPSITTNSAAKARGTLMHSARKTDRIHASSDAAKAVERDADGVPVAMRLWRAGPNPTDYGVSVFSEESAALLLEEQARRGNRYSFDINHLSLDKDAPLENQRAVGSFAIEVRNGECWAVDCRWTRETREELAAGGWLSISPAYDARTDDGVIVSLLNCALTGSPATHNATALAATRLAASRGRGETMTAAARIPTDVLRLVATNGVREIAARAKQELSRRGEQVTDPNTEQGARLAGMMPRPGIGIQHGAKTSEFGVLTREAALEHLKNKR
jgi:hypothetical protein